MAFLYHLHIQKHTHIHKNIFFFPPNNLITLFFVFVCIFTKLFLEQQVSTLTYMIIHNFVENKAVILNKRTLARVRVLNAFLLSTEFQSGKKTLLFVLYGPSVLWNFYI